MLKRKPSRLSLNMKCADCVFFKKVRGSFNGNKTCKSIGIQRFAHACRLFNPDLAQLTTVPPDSIYQIAFLAKDLSANALRLMSYVFRNIEQVRKYGFNFGQPVYFNLSSPHIDYLECYFRGYLLGVSPNGEHAYVTSSLDNVNATFLTLHLENLYTKSQFKRKRTSLEDSGKVHIPTKSQDCKFKINRELSKAHHPHQDDVPTLDTVPNDWLYKYENNLKLVDPIAPRRSTNLDVSTVGNTRVVEIKV